MQKQQHYSQEKNVPSSGGKHSNRMGIQAVVEKRRMAALKQHQGEAVELEEKALLPYSNEDDDDVKGGSKKGGNRDGTAAASSSSQYAVSPQVATAAPTMQQQRSSGAAVKQPLNASSIEDNERRVSNKEFLPPSQTQPEEREKTNGSSSSSRRRVNTLTTIPTTNSNNHHYSEKQERGGGGKEEQERGGTNSETEIVEWILLNQYVDLGTYTSVVRHLSISSVIVEDHMWHWLFRVIPLLQMLEHLDLSDTGFDDERCRGLFGGGPTTLRSGAFGTGHPSSQQSLPTMLSSQANLVSLELSHNLLTFKSAHSLGAFLEKQAQSLKYICLKDNRFKDHGLQILASYLGRGGLQGQKKGATQQRYSSRGDEGRSPSAASSQQPNKEGQGGGVWSIDVSNNQASIRGIAEILVACSTNRSVKNASLQTNAFHTSPTDQLACSSPRSLAKRSISMATTGRSTSMKSVASSGRVVGPPLIPTFPRDTMFQMLCPCMLQTIDLSNCHLHAKAGAEMLRVIFYTCPILRELILKGNELDDTLVVVVIENRCPLRHLSLLDVSDNLLTDSGAEGLIQAFTTYGCFPRLVELLVRGNQLSGEGCLKLLELVLPQYPNSQEFILQSPIPLSCMSPHFTPAPTLSVLDLSKNMFCFEDEVDELYRRITNRVSVDGKWKCGATVYFGHSPVYTQQSYKAEQVVEPGEGAEESGLGVRGSSPFVGQAPLPQPRQKSPPAPSPNPSAGLQHKEKAPGDTHQDVEGPRSGNAIPQPQDKPDFEIQAFQRPPKMGGAQPHPQPSSSYPASLDSTSDSLVHRLSPIAKANRTDDDMMVAEQPKTQPDEEDDDDKVIKKLNLSNAEVEPQVEVADEHGENKKGTTRAGSWYRKSGVLPPTNTIWYTSTAGEYGCFNNAYEAPFIFEGEELPTAEDHFLAKNATFPSDEDWEKSRDAIMYNVVLAKFEQHPALAKILLSTGNKDIVKRTRKDRYWGDGWGVGANMMGKTLMKVRAVVLQKTQRGDETYLQEKDAAAIKTSARSIHQHHHSQNASSVESVVVIEEQSEEEGGHVPSIQVQQPTSIFPPEVNEEVEEEMIEKNEKEEKVEKEKEEVDGGKSKHEEEATKKEEAFIGNEKSPPGEKETTEIIIEQQQTPKNEGAENNNKEDNTEEGKNAKAVIESPETNSEVSGSPATGSPGSAQGSPGSALPKLNRHRLRPFISVWQHPSGHILCQLIHLVDKNLVLEMLTKDLHRVLHGEDYNAELHGQEMQTVVEVDDWGAGSLMKVRTRSAESIHTLRNNLKQAKAPEHFPSLVKLWEEKVKNSEFRNQGNEKGDEGINGNYVEEVRQRLLRREDSERLEKLDQLIHDFHGREQVLLKTLTPPASIIVVTQDDVEEKRDKEDVAVLKNSNGSHNSSSSESFHIKNEHDADAEIEKGGMEVKEQEEAEPKKEEEEEKEAKKPAEESSEAPLSKISYSAILRCADAALSALDETKKKEEREKQEKELSKEEEEGKTATEAAHQLSTSSILQVDQPLVEEEILTREELQRRDEEIVIEDNNVPWILPTVDQLISEKARKEEAHREIEERAVMLALPYVCQTVFSSATPSSAFVGQKKKRQDRIANEKQEEKEETAVQEKIANSTNQLLFRLVDKMLIHPEDGSAKITTSIPASSGTKRSIESDIKKTVVTNSSEQPEPSSVKTSGENDAVETEAKGVIKNQPLPNEQHGGAQVPSEKQLEDITAAHPSMSSSEGITPMPNHKHPPETDCHTPFSSLISDRRTTSTMMAGASPTALASTSKRQRLLPQTPSPSNRNPEQGGTTTTEFLGGSHALAQNSSLAAHSPRIAQYISTLMLTTVKLGRGEIALDDSIRNKIKVCEGKWKEFNVTLSIEWDEFLFLKTKKGGLFGATKELVLVHPLIANDKLFMLGMNNELILQLQRPKETLTQQQPQPGGAGGMATVLISIAIEKCEDLRTAVDIIIEGVKKASGIMQRRLAVMYPKTSSSSNPQHQVPPPSSEEWSSTPNPPNPAPPNINDGSTPGNSSSAVASPPQQQNYSNVQAVSPPFGAVTQPKYPPPTSRPT